MFETLMIGLVCLFAVYGLLVVIISAIDDIKPKSDRARDNVRVVILVKNAGDNIEEIVRNAVKYDIPGRAMSSCNLAIVDLGSADETLKILEKLGREYQCLDVYTFEEKDKVFCGLS